MDDAMKLLKEKVEVRGSGDDVVLVRWGGDGGETGGMCWCGSRERVCAMAYYGI